MPAKLVILRDSDLDWIRVYTPYSDKFVAAIKGLEHKYRFPVFRDEGSHKVFDYWRVQKLCLAEVVGILQDCFPGSDIESDLVEALPAPSDSPYTVLCLQDGAPRELVDAAYRTLAKLYHPDMPGGDTRRMTAINVAYQTITHPGQGKKQRV